MFRTIKVPYVRCLKICSIPNKNQGKTKNTPDLVLCRDAEVLVCLLLPSKFYILL